MILLCISFRKPLLCFSNWTVFSITVCFKILDSSQSSSLVKVLIYSSLMIKLSVYMGLSIVDSWTNMLKYFLIIVKRISCHFWLTTIVWFYRFSRFIWNNTIGPNRWQTSTFIRFNIRSTQISLIICTFPRVIIQSPIVKRILSIIKCILLNSLFVIFTIHTHGTCTYYITTRCK